MYITNWLTGVKLINGLLCYEFVALSFEIEYVNFDMWMKSIYKSDLSII